MRYRFIETHKKVWPITLMCNVLNVSSSGFYEWVHRRPSRRAIANDRLDGHIRQVFDQHQQRYGAPRIVDEINGRGLSCSENRVARRMRVLGGDLRAALIAGLATGLALLGSGLTCADEAKTFLGFRLLDLENQSVKWRTPTFGKSAVVTYAFATGPISTPGARNCAAMFTHPIPAEFWRALRERNLVDPRSPLPA